MQRLFFALAFLALLLSGCAIGGGALAVRQTHYTNGVVEIEKVRTLPFIAWGDAKQAIAGQKVSNTKAGNSIGQMGYGQETTTTNLPANLRAGGALIGASVAEFLKSQGVP